MVLPGPPTHPSGPSPPDPNDPRWANDVVLADGTTVQVRPISVADADALVAFHERQSRESIYFRFFSPRPRLSDDEVRHLTTVDGIDRMAFVAERSDELVGVARYDRYGGQSVAEVAFFTDDQMGGRGIATLLLEYLAAYAREVGINRFEAQVLPSNRRMSGVFRQAGFEVSSTFADGVVEVILDIEPSEDAASAMQERARMAERQSVVRLLEPRSVAVIGAGRSPGGIGHRVLRNLLRGPFRGAVYPVHHEARSVAGVRAYATIGDVPDEVDLAVVCVPATEVVEVVEECGRARVGAAVVISAGFAEAGREGAAEQRRLLSSARRYGLRILGPNCLGVLNTDPGIRLHATFAEIEPLPGRVGLLSQSGTLGAVILEAARAAGVGISSFVAVGNKADLSGNDMLQYWLDDDRTDVVLLYLESFGNPRRFGRNVREVANRKPVFAVRSGAVLEGPDQAPGAGWLDDRTIDALLRQTGVIRVPTVRALLDAALVASNQPIPSGRGVAVVGNSGGSASMAADACVTAGLELVGLDERTEAVIDAHRLHGRAASNPVDLSYDADEDRYAAVLDAVLVDPAVDMVLVAHAPYDFEDHERITAVLDRVAARHPDATIAACIYGDHPAVTDGGIPVFDFPDDAALALGRVARYGLWLAAETSGTVRTAPDARAVSEKARALLGDEARRTLEPDEARALLQAGGVATVPVQVLRNADELPSSLTEGRVALKAEHHRRGATTQSAGVALDLHDLEAVREAVDAIAVALGDDAWPMLLQPMVAPGTDVRIAVETHPIVGPVVQVGPGGGAGRYAAAPQRVLPVSDLAAGELVDEAGLDVVLDAEARLHLLELIRSVGAVVDAAPEVAELVCDPVILRADGADVVEVQIALSQVRPDAPSVRQI